MFETLLRRMRGTPTLEVENIRQCNDLTSEELKKRGIKMRNTIKVIIVYFFPLNTSLRAQEENIRDTCLRNHDGQKKNILV